MFVAVTQTIAIAVNSAYLPVSWVGAVRQAHGFLLSGKSALYLDIAKSMQCQFIKIQFQELATGFVFSRWHQSHLSSGVVSR